MWVLLVGGGGRVGGRGEWMGGAGGGGHCGEGCVAQDRWSGWQKVDQIRRDELDVRMSVIMRVFACCEGEIDCEMGKAAKRYRRPQRRS